MKKSQEQVFLQVKQRLDYYRLPTIFPYQAVDLLSQLLNILDKSAKRDGKQNNQFGKNHSSNQLNDALRLEIGKVVKENNKLHMDLLSAKQEILALKYHNDKFLIQRSGGSKQIVQLIQAQRKREDELFQQLTHVKFQFNQLMDMVHEDSQIQKKYIKRLRKYKKFEQQQKKPHLDQKQFKKGPHQTVSELQAKIILLQNKVANRQSQIMRLHKKTQFDGLNMNKILKDFDIKQTNTKVGNLQHQIEYLQQQNKKMKQQVKYCRKNGGDKEALRQQMRRNSEKISQLQSSNKQLKKQLKHKQHDVQAKLKQAKRQSDKIKENAKKQADQLQLANLIIADLNKKVQFLKGQVETAKISIEKEQKQNIQKQSTIQRIKNEQQGIKLLSQYEIQSLKQTIQQLQTEGQSLQQKVNLLKAENDYHKKQDKLKNEAIQNLQKIVDELMKRGIKKGQEDQISSQSQNLPLQNTINLRRTLMQYKQSLSIMQNQKQRLSKEYDILQAKSQQKTQQNNLLNSEMKQLKIKIQEMKYSLTQNQTFKRQISSLQSDLKKQQNLRMKIEQISHQSEGQKNKFRKQLQQLTQQYQIYEKKAKNNMNSLKMEVSQLQQNKEMLELIIKEKDKKVLLLNEQIQQLHGKIKILKQEIKTLQDQKHTAIREKHKYQKRCQEMLKVKEQNDKKAGDLQDRQLHNRVLQYQKQIQKLREKISTQNEQISQLNSYCEAIKLSEKTLSNQRSLLKRQYQKMKINKDKTQENEQDQEGQHQQQGQEGYQQQE